MYDMDSVSKHLRQQKDESDRRCDALATDLERCRLSLRDEISKNEELKSELRMHNDYRQKSEFELRTLGEEVEKYKIEREAEDYREIASLKT